MDETIDRPGDTPGKFVGMADAGAVAGRPEDDPAMAAFSPRPATPRSRSGKVWIASIVLVLFGLVGLLAAGLLLMAANEDVRHGRDVAGVFYALVYIQFGLSTLQVTSGVLLWLGVRWAVGLATAICVINMIGNVVTFFAGAFLPASIGLILNLLLLRLVRSDKVAEWCDLA
jgi:hypothetical protein